MTVSSTAPVYLFSGMTAEVPVFDRILPLLPNAKIVEYVDPLPRESLTRYAARIARQLPKKCIVAGASFGGVVALEVARYANARACFLIGSIRGPHQLPPWLRLWRLLGGRNCEWILQIAGDSTRYVPRRLRTAPTARLAKLSGPTGAWHRWATAAVLDWRPSSHAASLTIQIHGDADTTFPILYMTPDVVIPGGKHSLSVSHPDEVAKAILAYLNIAVVTKD